MTRPGVLLLNGSPHSGGQTVRLASALLKALPAKAHIVNLYQEKITPCLGCYACARGRPCPLNDSMPMLFDALARADIVLFASPLHFTSLTAPLIAFIGRLQPIWQAKLRGETPIPPRSRQGALVATAGSEYPRMFEAARAVTAAAMKTLDIHLAGLALAANTDNTPVDANAKALADAEKLGETLSGLFAS